MTERAFNSADPAQVKERERSAKDQLKQQQADLRMLLATPEFRRFIWRLIGERCMLLQSPGSNNGSIQSANVGRQDVGRELWVEIESVEPLAIPRMMQEHHEAQK